MLAGLAMLIAASVSYAHIHAPNGIGGDKYRNTKSQHATNVEPDSFAWGNTIVSAYQVGRFNNGGGSNIGFATSTDGGQTWIKGGLPGTTDQRDSPGPWARVSDPVVAYDPEHNVWMIGTLGIDAGGTGLAVLTSRSTDGGLTWQNPVTTSLSSGTFYDKNWLVCDTWASSPHYGNCYAEWDDNGLGNQMLMSTSTDGGLTWGPKIAPPGSVRARRPAGRAAERHRRRAVHGELQRDLRVPLPGRRRYLDVGRPSRIPVVCERRRRPS